MENPFSLLNKAKMYTRFRPLIPAEVLDFLRCKLELSVNDKLNRFLDFGCGTGLLTAPLSIYASKTIGLDSSKEMLIEAKNNINKDICWYNLPVEKIPDNFGLFDLITTANTLTWVDIGKTFPIIYKHLKPGGNFVFFSTCTSFWEENSSWQKLLLPLVKKWFNVEDYENMKDAIARDAFPWGDKLEPPYFKSIETHIVKCKRFWNYNSLLGFLFSISFINRNRLGDHAEDFELDIRENLFDGDKEKVLEEDHIVRVTIALRGTKQT